MFVRSPTITNPVSGVIRNGSRPLKVVYRSSNVGTWRAGDVVHRVGDHPDVLGRGAAASAHDVHQARPGELAEQAARGLGRLVVAAERVRQTGVRVAAHGDRRDARERLDVGAHLGGAERAVDADDHRARRARSRPRTPRASDRTACARSGRRSSPRSIAGARAPRPSPPRSRPSRSACRRSSRSAAGRRRRRAGRGSARRTPRTPGRTRSSGTTPRRPWATWRA